MTGNGGGDDDDGSGDVLVSIHFTVLYISQCKTLREK